MKIIVGLGNPGEKYKKTRHNVGFMAIDYLVEQINVSMQMNKKFNAEFFKTGDTIYIKPQTYMNNSGRAIESVMAYYNLIPKKFKLIKKKDCDLSDILTIIHDDLDIELGKIKISDNSRSAGNRGVQSTIDYMKTKNFKRLRIGIKTDSLINIPAEKFVLQKFNNDEMNIINNLIKNSIQNNL